MGLPKLLTSDQGREFRCQLDKGLMKLIGTNQHYTTPYHPQVLYSVSYDILLCVKLNRQMD